MRLPQEDVGRKYKRSDVFTKCVSGTPPRAEQLELDFPGDSEKQTMCQKEELNSGSTSSGQRQKKGEKGLRPRGVEIGQLESRARGGAAK